MSIKTKHKDKIFIEQLILTEEDNPGVWKTQESYDKCFRKDNELVGFLFSTKAPVGFGTKTIVLNLYLLNKWAYKSDIVSLDAFSLFKGWCEYCEICLTTKKPEKQMIFVNPPLREWLASKDNWVKKQTYKFSEKFKLSYDDALSEVYYTIVKLYNKRTVYMGNLNYVQAAINNSFLASIRFNKNRLSGTNTTVVSLDKEMSFGEDESVTLHDIIGQEDPSYAENDAIQFEIDVRTALLSDFSKREIDQILNNKSGYLPQNLYRRLIKWRKAHDMETFRREIENGK